MARVLLVLAAAGGLLAASGCADRGYVQREWSATLREYGIVPVFPPREDVYVGDVYAYDYDPESLETQRLMEKEYWKLSNAEKSARMQLGMSPRLYRIDLTREAADEYKRTPSWPQTTPEYNQILPAAEFQQITKLQAAQDDIVTAKTAAITAAERDIKRLTDEKRLAELELKSATDQRTDAIATRDDLRKQLGDARKALLNEQVRLGTIAQGTPEFTTQQNIVSGANVRVNTLAAQLATAETAVVAAELLASNKQKLVDDKTAEIAKLQDVKVKAEAAIAEAKRTIDEIKKMRAALGGAGTKYLYGQPRDPTYDVYTGDSLPKRILKDGKPDVEAQASDLVNSRQNRIRLVAFPDFAATTFTEGQLNALVPVEAFALGVRGNFADLDSVSVKVPAAESYCVPIEDVRGHLVQLGRTTSFAQLRSDIALTVRQNVLHRPPQGAHDPWSPEEIAEFSGVAARLIAEQAVRDGSARPGAISDDDLRLAFGRALGELKLPRPTPRSMLALVTATSNDLQLVLSRPSDTIVLHDNIHAAAQFQMLKPNSEDDGNYYYVRVITEVFYARAMDISLTAKTSFGARAELETVAQIETEDGKAPTPVEFQNPQPGTGPVKDPSVVTATDLVTRTQAQLGERLKVPGGSVQLLSYSERSIGLRRVFDRPVAIGFRGLTLKVDRETGVVHRVQPPSGNIPSVAKSEGG